MPSAHHAITSMHPSGTGISIDTNPRRIYIASHASAESRQAARPSEPKAPRPRRFFVPASPELPCTCAIQTSPAQPVPAVVKPRTSFSPALPSLSGIGGMPTAKCLRFSAGLAYLAMKHGERRSERAPLEGHFLMERVFQHSNRGRDARGGTPGSGVDP